MSLKKSYDISYMNEDKKPVSSIERGRFEFILGGCTFAGRMDLLSA